MKVPAPDRISIIRVAEQHLPAIAELAGNIWRACYPNIISHAQIEYMLAQMYALDTLREEIRSQGIRYDLLRLDRKPAGFASYGPTSEPNETKLHKLYVIPELHGHGLGSLPCDTLRGKFAQPEHIAWSFLSTSAMTRQSLFI